jgi:hypothetical protein
MRDIGTLGGVAAEIIEDCPNEEVRLGVLGRLLSDLFIERRDVKAWQSEDGKYFPDLSEVTDTDLHRHLSGERTLGHYLLSPEDKCRLLAFDLDLTETGVWNGEPIAPRVEFANLDSLYRAGLIGQVLIVAETLARMTYRELDVPVAIAVSGSKGCHVYGFTGSEPASLVRGAALDVIDACGCFGAAQGASVFAHEHAEMNVHVEVFPKQASLEGKKFGNLMRLPLGRNRKTGNEGFFVRVGGDRRSTFCPMDPVAALGGQLPWSDQ